MLTREDRVVLVQKSDGSQAVEHADGTRITSWYQDRPADVAAQGDPSVQEGPAGPSPAYIGALFVRCSRSAPGDGVHAHL